MRELDSQSAQNAYSDALAANAAASLMPSVTADPLTAINAINSFFGRVADFLAEPSSEEATSGDSRTNAETGETSGSDGGQGGTEDLYVPDGFSFSSS
ncbi:MAG: hypothetical protein ACI87W_000900 [Halieaceae bacterium]